MWKFCLKQNPSDEIMLDDYPANSPNSSSGLNVEQELNDLIRKNGVLEQHVYMLKNSLVEKDNKITALEEKMDFLFQNQRMLVTAIMEDTKMADTKEDQDTGVPCQGDQTSLDSTSKCLTVLRVNYMLLTDVISPGVGDVVAFLFQEGIITDRKKEEILAESQNRFLRSKKVLDIVLSQGSRTNAYEVLYRATLEAKLWTAADILYPKEAPHDPNEGEVEEREDEKTSLIIPVQGASPTETKSNLTKEQYQELSRQVESLAQKVSSLEIVQKSFASRLGETEGNADIEAVKSDIQEQLSREKQKEVKLAKLEEDLLNTQTDINDRFQNISEDLQNLENQVGENKTAISTMTSYQAITQNTVFRVELDHIPKLTTNVLTRLDRCPKVHMASPYFDEATCWFTIPINGVYHFNVTVGQRGHGRLEVAVGPGDGTTYNIAFPCLPASWTDMTYDVRSGSLTSRLSEGKRVGVWVIRRLGLAELSWFRISGCLVCP